MVAMVPEDFADGGPASPDARQERSPGPARGLERLDPDRPADWTGLARPAAHGAHACPRSPTAATTVLKAVGIVAAAALAAVKSTATAAFLSAVGLC